MKTQTVDCVHVRQKGRDFYLLKLPAKTLVQISYAAIRGQSEEAGSVQRILSQRRISKIKDFTIQVATYPSSIILNWVNSTHPITVENGKLSLRPEPRSAQIIDGQHRVAGIRAAIEQEPSAAKLEIPVAMYDGLDTTACADIFLSINTEQKPVPKSLVFDLYGISSTHLVDPAAERARDIATALNEDETSPYYGLIKFPGLPRTKGGIALSTAVSALKPLVEPKGVLEQVGICDLADQTQIIVNLFTALRNKYEKEWDSRDNAFMYASGFQGALQFFRNKLVDYCNLKKSFEVRTIEAALDLSETNLIRQEDVRGLGGKIASERIVATLVDLFDPGDSAETRIAI